MKKVIKNKKGFTLVELIVCIAIIAILAAILVPALMGYIKKSNLSKAKSNVQSAYTAISSYIADCEVGNETVPADDAAMKSALSTAGKATLGTEYTITMASGVCTKVVYTNGNVTATLDTKSGEVQLQYAGKDVDDNGKEK